MKGAAEGEPHEKQRSEIQIQRLEIQIQKFERRSRGGSHIPILASVSIRPTAHTPNYFPHSIPPPNPLHGFGRKVSLAALGVALPFQRERVTSQDE